MGADQLGSRAIIGEFYKTLQADFGQSWIPKIAMLFQSNQESETYKWLGQIPALRAWTGPRSAKGFWQNGVTLTNQEYEATLEVLVRDLRRDKTGQILTRIREMAIRGNTHWASLLSTLILAGASTTCYDGQFFFDTDHQEGNNTTNQSNSISVDISALPAAVHGSTTAPSAQEMTLCILQAISAIVGFKDNENEPMNELANQFLVMVPNSLYSVGVSAVANTTFGGGETNVLQNAGFNVSLAANSRLTWTTQFAVFRTDGNVKPFIIQEETPLLMKAKAEGSEFEFDNNAHQYGVDTSRAVGYGYWQHGCLVTMT